MEIKTPIFPQQNFHLMDYHLAIFITVMLARRLVWTIVSEVNADSISVSSQHCRDLIPHDVSVASMLSLIAACCSASVSPRCLSAAGGLCCATCF